MLPLPLSNPADASDYKAIIYRHYVSSCGPGRPAANLSPAEERSRFDFFQAKLSRWLPSDRQASFLDLGCGAGLLLKFLAQRGYPHLTGVDLSPEQCQAARAAAPGAAIREMNLFEFLAGKNNEYDCITALDVIEHLDKASALPFLHAVFQALKPGGRLILQTPNAASPWGMAIRYGDFTHDLCLTPGSLRQLLTLAGFQEIALQPAGPIVRSLKGMIRVGLWKLLALFWKWYNLIEMGSAGDGIYTRVFLCLARKPAAS
jgi:SAM-dependent methyltransferase